MKTLLKQIVPLQSLLLGVALTGAALLAHAQTQPATHYSELKFPKMNDIKVPEPVRFELANGLVVYLLEDHELPKVEARAMIHVDSRWEPVEKVGLADITASVMRTGGTATRTGDQLDEELDRLGASVEIGDGSAFISVLKEDVDKGLSILADLLQHPAFPEDKIELEKIAHKGSISRRNDEPSGIAYREFNRVLYGKDSPYAHQTEYATIDAITRADLKAFHKRYYQPESTLLGIWGDFKTDEMRAKLERYFGVWARGGQPKPEVPGVDAAARERAGVYYIEKADFNQSWVLMGHLGGQMNDPDFFALTVMNRILGGGMSSRLFSHVRTEQGLAYNVRSSWGAAWDHPGSFLASGSTKFATTLKMLDSIKKEIKQMAEVEVSDEELNRAKDGILKGFAFEFDSIGKVLTRMMTYEFYGYPKDYLQRYRENIDKVTKADVLRVAKQHLKPDQCVVLVLGKDKEFDQPLSTLGTVNKLDITIPGQPAEEK